MNNIFVLSLLLLLAYFNNAFKIRLTKYEGKCKGHKNLSAFFTDIKLYEKDGNQYLEQSLQVNKEIPEIDKLVIIARRCPSRDDLDHCENFRNITVPHIGLLAMDKNSPWQEKMSYSPPLSFPIKPGTYVSQHTKMDQKWSVIVSKGYWRNYAVFLSKSGEEVMCIYAEGEIV